jgi:redox-sensitive bicupin YhaK (pirin superfamily)
VQTLNGHTKDLGGGFTVSRLLPDARRRAVGPFVFFDHFGPVLETPGAGHDVRPHPHIGLATVTYLFEGAMTHRDSTGVTQVIEPGAINWMTAGRGIVHSERKPEHLQHREYTNHGLQLWVGLPTAHEEAEPSFAHTPASAIPELRVGVSGQSTVRVLVGTALGAASPVQTLHPTLYLDVQLAAGDELVLDGLPHDMAVYPVDAPITVDGAAVAARQMAVLADGAGRVHLGSAQAARVVLIGGDPLDGDGPRYMWWNFVSSRKERIEQAKADWATQPNAAFGQVAGETEFIPLPPP